MDRTAPDADRTDNNATAAASLQRRRARAVRWFRVGLALTPAGLAAGVVAVLGFASDPNGPAWAVLCLAGILVLCVGLGAMMLMASDHGKYRRSLALLDQADRMGFRFTEKPAQEDWLALRGPRVFQWPDRRDTVVNMLGGSATEGPVYALEYCYSLRTPAGQTASQQTVIALPDAAAGLPDFLLFPKGWLDRAVGILSHPSVQLPDQPEFNQRLSLRGEDADRIAACFAPEVVALVLQEKGLWAEAQNGLLVLFRKNKIARPEEYPDLIARALRLARALRAGARQAPDV
jgi:hypothetical protein